MKALVLAAGRGRRLGPRSDDRNKCMIAARGRPLLDYVLDAVCIEPVDEVVLVVGYRAEGIMNYFGTSHKGTRLRYAIQWQRRGIVDAMARGAEVLAGDDFILALGDELMVGPKVGDLVQTFHDRDLFAACGVVVVEEEQLVRRTYSVLHDESGTIRRLVEKPEVPFNNLLGTGVCVFRNKILSFIPTTPVHPIRGEKELPALIQAAVDAGHRVGSAPVCDTYFNLNSERDLDEIQTWSSRT